MPPTDTSPAIFRIEDLRDPGAFGHPVVNMTVRETHISWVVLTGPFAYKIKKPVNLDFIDASTLERRLHHCTEELRLNRRLAPDLYIDVVPITRLAGQTRIGAAEGEIIDYAVRMKQFDSDHELPRLLSHQAVTPHDIRMLGELLGTFHLQARKAPATRGLSNTEHMYDAVAANLAELHRHAAEMEHPAILQRLTDWTRFQARMLEEVFKHREECGYVRECHGDLHAGNIVLWQERLMPFDCIEFNPRLRWIDVISDVAFLAMDLTSRSRPDLAATLLSSYLETTGDYAGMELLPFYAVYRALVRAKVDVLTAAQSQEHSAGYLDRLQHRLSAALQWTQPPQGALVLMHGVSGSGKSWLSERLIARMPALRVRSDLERKRLAAPAQPWSTTSRPYTGLYAPPMSHRTYARLLECAESCLAAGFHTVVDAAFLERSDRELFQGLAARMQRPFLIVSCGADPATLSARVRDRGASGRDASDATPQILEEQLRHLQPLDAAEQSSSISADTRDEAVVERVVAQFRARN